MLNPEMKGVKWERHRYHEVQALFSALGKQVSGVDKVAALREALF